MLEIQPTAFGLRGLDSSAAVLRQWLPPGKEYDFLCVNVRDRSVDLGNDCGLGAGAREP